MNAIELFTDTVRDYIAAQGITVTEFARRIGCKERCAARWLNGTNRPSTEFVLLAADALHCSVDFLFARTDSPALTPARSPSRFAERLCGLIGDSGRNKRTLAREWGVEPSTVTKWLHGASLPKPDRVYRLADFFGCSMDFLLGRTDAA